VHIPVDGCVDDAFVYLKVIEVVSKSTIGLKVKTD